MAQSFLTLMARAAREAERANRARIREQERQARRELQEARSAVREQERSKRDAIKSAKERQREEKKAYVESRLAEVEEANTDLDEADLQIENLLLSAFSSPVGFDWQSLYRKVDAASFGNPQAPPQKKDFAVRRPGFFGQLLPGWKARHEQKLENAKTSFLNAHYAYSQDQAEFARQAAIHAREVEEQNSQISYFRDAYLARNPEAVCGFVELVFEQQNYPESFPRKWKTAFLPDSRQLIVDFDLPTIDDAVPSVERYRYNKSADEIVESKKSDKLRQSAYADLVAKAVLRRLYEVFNSDQDGVIEVVALNAFVETVDPATGQAIKPCLISVRTTRNEFSQIDLRRVDPAACLKRLNASVSRSPSELAAVKPIVDINMSDPRFVQETDVLSTLDSRPNLMDLTPGEFESLITNLFAKMGLETRLTQASRDGGVDCVAYDARPVLGGKVIIQAKRYKNTVGVSAVRDLFGTMHNEGASKGILVTTSGYGKAAFEFQSGKPLELLSGGELLYLLKEHAGIEAKIVMPEDWRDPV